MDKTKHLYWYREWLPHFDQPGEIQSITFRLKDALPREVLDKLIADAVDEQNPKKIEELDALYNAGHGECLLERPDIATIVEQSLQYFDGERYGLLAWVIMPNHVHILARMFEGYPLATVVGAWKSYTAKEINKLLGRSGHVWYREYFDRYIRNEAHFWTVVEYIYQNPVKAGLVDRPEQWRFGSARLGCLTEESAFSQ